MLAYKDKSERAKGLRERSSLTLEDICGLEPGLPYEGLAHTLAIVCLSQAVMLGFDSREAMCAWDARIRYALGEVRLGGPQGRGGIQGQRSTDRSPTHSPWRGQSRPGAPTGPGAHSVWSAGGGAPRSACTRELDRARISLGTGNALENMVILEAGPKALIPQGMGCSREKGKTQPPHMPTRLVKQRQAGPQLRRQNPRLASFIRAASSQCCVGCGQGPQGFNGIGVTGRTLPVQAWAASSLTPCSAADPSPGGPALEERLAQEAVEALQLEKRLSLLSHSGRPGSGGDDRSVSSSSSEASHSDVSASSRLTPWPEPSSSSASTSQEGPGLAAAQAPGEATPGTARPAPKPLRPRQLQEVGRQSSSDSGIATGSHSSYSGSFSSCAGSSLDVWRAGDELGSLLSLPAAGAPEPGLCACPPGVSEYQVPAAPRPHYDTPRSLRQAPRDQPPVAPGSPEAGAGVFFLSSTEGDQISFLFDCIVRGISPTKGPFGLRPVLPGECMLGDSRPGRDKGALGIAAPWDRGPLGGGTQDCRCCPGPREGRLSLVQPQVGVGGMDGEGVGRAGVDTWSVDGAGGVLPSEPGWHPTEARDRAGASRYALIDVAATEAAHRAGAQHAQAREERLPAPEQRPKAAPR
ncbi:PREDICTED: protein Dok-7 [Bison bison bison]|uniref:Protein Dok-7 n=1 Tax=Bison bison bison TaxID=43346 RepID=A0A6P3I3Q3_BISBB|nr:PREDICTED: protein Dok-7 [Bison bison bison]